MNKERKSGRIKLATYEEMFGIVDNTPKQTERTDETAIKDGQVVELPLSEIHIFENHPFRVVDDENMEELVESIKEYGVVVPAIVRSCDKGGYELISGHRRKYASEMAGKETMPVIIRDCSDDEATIIMVDANIQRENILISEKAKAYRMKYNAMKHQGRAKGNSLQEMSEQTGESMKTIQRLICIAGLNKELLDMVDDKKLGLRQGLDISFISEDLQKVVYKVINEMNISLSLEQSARVKEAYRKGYLNEDFLKDYLSEKKSKPRKVVLKKNKLDDYFAPDMTSEDIEKIIICLLDEWKKKGDVK